MAAPVKYTFDMCPEISVDKKDGGTILYENRYCSTYKLIGHLKKMMNKDYLIKMHVEDANRRLTEIRFIGCTAIEYKKYKDAYAIDRKAITGGKSKVIKKKNNIKKTKAKK